MTVLIIGGSFQGKREIAEKLYPDEPKIYNLHEKVREMLQREQDPLELSATLRGHVIKLAAAWFRSNQMTKTGAKPLVGCAVRSHRKRMRSSVSGRACRSLLKES